MLGYSHLPKNRKFKTLGIGSAYGDEFLPIKDVITDLIILEPSEDLQKSHTSIPTTYLSPNIYGNIPLRDGSFDLITSLGVLHHIPNVSHLVKEMARCLKKDGYMLIREPIVSMGDWTHPRPNLTPRERGIPLNIFRDILKLNGLKIIHENKCIFPLIPIISSLLNFNAYNSKTVTFFDRLLSLLFSWNNIYHPTNVLQKLRPGSVFYVIQKK